MSLLLSQLLGSHANVNAASNALFLTYTCCCFFTVLSCAAPVLLASRWCCRDLYADSNAEGAVGDGEEPELRRQLRAARAAEKHAKMKAALAEQQAKEAAESERRQQQQAHKQAHKERIEAWRNKNKVGARCTAAALSCIRWKLVAS
jgi:hypothetical protein